MPCMIFPSAFDCATVPRDSPFLFGPVLRVPIMQFGTFRKEVTGETQIEHRPLFEDALKNKRTVEKATIPVENIKRAVLLILGKEDGVWPSTTMAGHRFQPQLGLPENVIESRAEIGP